MAHTCTLRTSARDCCSPYLEKLCVCTCFIVDRVNVFYRESSTVKLIEVGTFQLLKKSCCKTVPFTNHSRNLALLGSMWFSTEESLPFERGLSKTCSSSIIVYFSDEISDRQFLPKGSFYLLSKIVSKPLLDFLNIGYMARWSFSKLK